VKKVAFYDLSVSPFSFDFATFLLCAKAKECTDVVIVPGERSYQKCTPGEQEYRLRNLILGLCPNAIVCQTREEAKTLWHEGCFPEGYTVEKPVYSHLLGQLLKQTKILPFMPTAEKTAEVKADWPQEKLVVITIRDTHIKPGRNSNVAEWVKAADWIKTIGLTPVFVPDTEKPDEVFGEHLVSKKAALDVQYRLALYEEAHLNLGVNNGPLALCMYSRRPFLYFRPITHGYPESHEEFWRKNGVPINSQLPWFHRCQRIIWQGGDDLENIKVNVERWIKAKAGYECGCEKDWCAKHGQDDWPLSVAPAYPIFGIGDGKLRGEQMGIALAVAKNRGWKQMKRKPMGKGKMSIVCYGPSLKHTWRNIDRSNPILSVSGAHDFLIERGIVPDYHMDCDPRVHKSNMLTKPHKAVKYRMATCCHPSMWEKLKGCDVELWHLHNDKNTEEWVAANDPGANMLGGGSTAGMRALEVASMLGYKRFEIHGMDNSYESNEVRHAGPHLGKLQNMVEVNCDDIWFKSSPQMVEAAKEVIMFIQNYDADLVFHGTGLTQAMVKHFLKRFRVIEPVKELEAA
jgi:uncharacterized Rossmann fold enzyme